ncbi:hypothetical protein Esti_000179 [Eimeria stiedai]
MLMRCFVVVVEALETSFQDKERQRLGGETWDTFAQLWLHALVGGRRHDHLPASFYRAGEPCLVISLLFFSVFTPISGVCSFESVSPRGLLQGVLHIMPWDGPSCRVWQAALLRRRPQRAPYLPLASLGAPTPRRNPLGGPLGSRRSLSRWTGAPLQPLTGTPCVLHRALTTGPPSSGKPPAGAPPRLEKAASDASWGPPRPDSGAPFHEDAETKGAQQVIEDGIDAAAGKGVLRSSSGSSGGEKPPPKKKKGVLMRVSLAAIAAVAAFLAIGANDRSFGTSSGEATRKQRAQSMTIRAAPDNAPLAAADGVAGGAADAAAPASKLEKHGKRDPDDTAPGSAPAADQAAPTAAAAAADKPPAAAAADKPPTAAAAAAKSNSSETQVQSNPQAAAGSEFPAAAAAAIKDAAAKAADAAGSSTADRLTPEAAAAAATDAANASQPAVHQALESKGQVLGKALHAKSEQRQQQQPNEQQQQQKAQQQQQQQHKQKAKEQEQQEQKEAASARGTSASAAGEVAKAGTAEEGAAKASSGPPEQTHEFLFLSGDVELGLRGSLEEAIAKEAAFLKGLDRDQMLGHALHLTRELEGLKRMFAQKVREKHQELKRAAEHQLKQFREDAKEAFEAQAVAALALVETRSNELSKMREELGEWLSSNQERMQALDSDLENMHKAFGALNLRAKTAVAATRVCAALASLERAFSRATPIGGPLRELSKVADDDELVTAAVESLTPFLSTLDAEPLTPPAAAVGQLNETLRRSARAAFVPEGSGLVAHLVGNLLGCMYTLLPVAPSFFKGIADSSQQPDDAQRRSQANILRQNLRVLADAKMHVERAEISSAVRCLDSLKGLARREAEEDLRKLRLSLLVQQALDAVRGRLMCINAQLAHQKDSTQRGECTDQRGAAAGLSSV